jgi:hypothetical protein
MGFVTRGGQSVGRILVGIAWASAACAFDSFAPGGSAGDGGETDDSGGSTSSTSGSPTSAATTAETESSLGGTSGSMDSTDSVGSTSPAGPCADAGCDPNASCEGSGERAVCTCNAGFWGDGLTCAALELDTLRVELPCNAVGCGTGGCVMKNENEATRMLVGDPTVVYDVTLRVRGVVEQKSYQGPGQDGYFHPDATPVADGWNTFGLSVADPGRSYYLNSGTSGIVECVPLDEEHVIPIRGGATLTLHADNGGDTCGVQNLDAEGEPIVVPDVPPAPGSFDGQFVQIDAVGITPI